MLIGAQAVRPQQLTASPGYGPSTTLDGRDARVFNRDRSTPTSNAADRAGARARDRGAERTFRSRQHLRSTTSRRGWRASIRRRRRQRSIRCSTDCRRSRRVRRFRPRRTPNAPRRSSASDWSRSCRASCAADSGRIPRRLRVVAIMGGVELDLREAELPPGVTEIRAFIFMGGLTVRVRAGRASRDGRRRDHGRLRGSHGRARGAAGRAGRPHNGRRDHGRRGRAGSGHRRGRLNTDWLPVTGIGCSL